MPDSRPNSPSRNDIVYDDGIWNEDGDVNMRDANASRGGGSRVSETSTTQNVVPATRQFEATGIAGSIDCGCSICRRHTDHVIEEGKKRNVTIEKAKRKLAEELAGQQAQQEAETLKREIAATNDRLRVRDIEVRDLRRQLEESQRNEERLRRDLDRARSAPEPLLPAYSGFSRGARYHDEPLWGWQGSDRRERSPPRRSSPPPRKRNLPDEWRQSGSRYEPPRQQARDDRYDGGRYERRDDRTWSERRERSRPLSERLSNPVTESEGQPSSSANRGQGEWREDRKSLEPIASTSTSTTQPVASTSSSVTPSLAPETSEFAGWSAYTATPGPSSEPTGYDDQASDYGSDASNASDEPPMSAAALAAMHQARARRGVGRPLEVSPHATAIPEALSFLGRRIRFVERRHLPNLGHGNNGVNPAQDNYNELVQLVNKANTVKKSERTPYQRAIGDFAVIPRVPGVKSKSHRRAPDDGDGLGLHLAYALQESQVQPRGIYVFNLPDHSNRRGVATSQVRTLITLRRMLPLHNDMYSTLAANDHFEFMTEIAIAIARIFLDPPTPAHPTPGFQSYQLRMSLLANASQVPRQLRRWNRAESADGPVTAENVVRFFTASGISSREFDDMLPFVAQLLWDNTVYGVDNAGQSAALYRRLRDTVIAAQGQWPVGLPGPSIYSQVPNDMSVAYALPRLPGRGQPLLVHTGSTVGTGSFIADPNYHSTRQPTASEYSAYGFPRGIPIAPWPVAGPSSASTDAEMADATATTSSAASAAATTSPAAPTSAAVEPTAPSENPRVEPNPDASSATTSTLPGEGQASAVIGTAPSSNQPPREDVDMEDVGKPDEVDSTKTSDVKTDEASAPADDAP